MGCVIEMNEVLVASLGKVKDAGRLPALRECGDRVDLMKRRGARLGGQTPAGCRRYWGYTQGQFFRPALVGLLRM